MSRFARAQSDVIGIVLLTAVVVILMALVGTTILATVDTQERPTADLKVSVNGTSGTITNVSIAHHGGTSLTADEVTVAFRANSTDRVPLTDFTEQQGDSDSIFNPGERWGYNLTTSELLRVVIAHGPTSTVLADHECDVPTTVGYTRC
ncbi:Protein of unknown function DUF1628 [Halorhabdus utahensis DSM 12940]|uniref:Archaeal Type IV pilin N-terminal domain-containing protein n=1 Tax=Halorhabdus utahensis (strain DSM 12940 / JCM 11049 / AX-2) TaxID=519442 RepID=C7NR13_HALUD|nr:type IV pilin N-terminal domain-containing protein [Halorhabdus utahensis]ACV12926.1 Protein of unknown function DUF1628 [Halorhabdus utahensis DSM 12940]